MRGSILLALFRRVRRVALPAAAMLVLLTAAACKKQPASPGTPPSRGGDDRPAVVVNTPPEAPAAAPATASSRSRATDNPAGWPPIEFEPPELHFGVLGPGEQGRGPVLIWNVGDEPLTIRKSVTSCGCTSTDRLDGKVIPAGGSLAFAVSMDPKSGLGEKLEGVSIIFHGYNEVVRYAFRAEVSLPVRADPPHLTAVDSETNQPTLTGEVKLSALDGRPFRVTASHGGPPDLAGFDPSIDPPRSEYVLRWDLTDLDAQRAVPWFWVVETDHPEAPIIDLRVRHLSTIPPRPAGRPFVPKDQRVVIGPVVVGQSVEVKAKLEYQPGMTPLPQTTAVHTQSNRIDIQLVDAVADGQVVTVRAIVTPTGGGSGLLYEKATIEISGFEMPLRVIGVIK